MTMQVPNSMPIMTAAMTATITNPNILVSSCSNLCYVLDKSSVSLLACAPSSELPLRILAIFSSVSWLAFSIYLEICSVEDDSVFPYEGCLRSSYECLSKSIIAFCSLSSYYESFSTYSKIASTSSACWAYSPSRYSRPSSEICWSSPILSLLF